MIVKLDTCLLPLHLQCQPIYLLSKQTEIETHKSELAREIATLKKCLTDTRAPELQAVKAERDSLHAKLQLLQQQQTQQQMQQQQGQQQPDERDQAVSRMSYVQINGTVCGDGRFDVDVDAFYVPNNSDSDRSFCVFFLLDWF